MRIGDLTFDSSRNINGLMNIGNDSGDDMVIDRDEAVEIVNHIAGYFDITGWIDIEKEEPIAGRQIIIMCTPLMGKDYVTVGEFDGNEYYDCMRTVRVSHWMPLPPTT